MAADYPSVLPGPVRDAYAKQYDQELRLVKMDDGGHRRRRRFTAQKFRTNITFKFNAKELTIWEAFIKYECNYGASSFNLTIGPNEPAREVKISGGAPRPEADGNDWKVTCPIVFVDAGPAIPTQFSMPLWPDEIPLPIKSGYGYAVQNFPIEDNFSEGGVAKSRNRFTTKEVAFPATFIFTQAERDAFWSFIRTTLLDGTLPFVMPFYNGLGLNPIKCYLLELPKEAENGACYSMECQIGTTNAPTLSLAEYIELIGGTLEGDYAIDYFAEDYTVPVIQNP